MKRMRINSASGGGIMETTYIPEYEEIFEEEYRGFKIYQVKLHDVWYFKVVDKRGFKHGGLLLYITDARKWIDTICKGK